MKPKIELISHTHNSNVTGVSSSTFAERRLHTTGEPSKEHATLEANKTNTWLIILRNQFEFWFPDTIPTMKLRYDLLKKNFIKEIFSSKAFIYPFLVSTYIRFCVANILSLTNQFYLFIFC